ncbi:hypothetical protein E1B28_003880 [Marasmius oreades]|uniref:Uncharacterized protein n=1 Tax=Marasmius oreades TaxID=181124 RepID=A0A9P7UXF4_9AGAR|nr:uncharacterized protein E1B28_003880 [Marasmius oreades]KAG7096444.1 hypothetical protein E1B28_003880 [Marasmius oreades]
MTFGDTISNGIQDVAALLPLLGTEQCEQHVGTALEKGFLYAAATPLSVFGTLGIVRTAFATLLATITYPFYGGIWLNDAGYSTRGSVSSMVIISPGTKQYGAEVNLEKVMKDQNINDPELVSNIEYSGWGERERIPLSWNFQLILTSALCAVISVSPYIYLIHNHWKDPSSWIFPLLRSSGSFLCVVSVQLALQIRIHHITNSSLLLMKIKHRCPLADAEAMKERKFVLEKRLSKLVEELDSRNKTPDEERSLDLEPVKQDYRDALAKFQSFSWSSWCLLLLQMLLAAGIFMTVAGYIGCFTLVNQSQIEIGPYVWLGMESALSIIRIFLWGFNPTWDDLRTGLTIRLELHPTGPVPLLPSHFDTDTPARRLRQPLELSPLLITIPNQQKPQAFTDRTQNPLRSPTPYTDTLFPLITTPHHLSQLSSCSLHDRPMGGYRTDQREGFIIESAGNFLATATTYVGPLRHLQVENISLFYSIVPYVNHADEAIKFLCTTALHSGSNASISIFTGGSKIPHAVYSSHCDELHGTRALQVTLENDITNHPDSIDILDTRTFNLIVDHSYNLFSQLLGGKAFPKLELLWTVTFPSHPAPNYPEITVPLTKFDEQYIRLCQTYDLKGDYCSRRGTRIIRVFSDPPAGSLQHALLAEYGVIMESTVLEMYLCCIEHDFTQVWGLPSVISRRLILEWIRKMQVRIDVERRQCASRFSDEPTEILETWDSLALELRALRLPDSLAVLQKWRKPLKAWLTMENIADAEELFELRPLSKLRHLKNALLPVFQTRIYGIYDRMVAFLRPTLVFLDQLVHNDSNSPSLFDRVDVPGSADLSPPHTVVNIRKASEDELSALAAQTHLFRTLQFRTVSHSGLQALLTVLDSNPQPPTALTTLNFRDIQYSFGRLDDAVVKLISSILTKNDNLICLVFDNCHVDDATLDHLRETIKNNREQWVRRATQDRTRRDKLVYLAGIQFSPGKEHNALQLTGNGGPSIYSNQEVFLTPIVEVFVLVSVPGRGKIVPIISLELADVDMFVTAKLQRFTGQTSDDDIPEVKARALRASDGQRTLRLELNGFPEVDEGCYELRIWVRERSYLFRDVEVNFVSVTGEQP